jgi:hypothetical protein
MEEWIELRPQRRNTKIAATQTLCDRGAEQGQFPYFGLLIPVAYRYWIAYQNPTRRRNPSPSNLMHPPDSTHALLQLFWLAVLSIPIACVAWTVTHEEIFREPREFCVQRSQACRKLLERKFFYLFTCEYCFSHYITLLFLWLTHFKLLMDDWRGYVLAFFALVFVANIYMNFYSRLRVEIHIGKAEAKAKELEIVKNGGADHEKSQGG